MNQLTMIQLVAFVASAANAFIIQSPSSMDNLHRQAFPRLSMQNLDAVVDFSANFKAGLTVSQSVYTGFLPDSLGSSFVTVANALPDDVQALRESLTMALPDKSPAEISDMVVAMTQVATTVQQRAETMKLNPSVRSSVIPDISTIDFTAISPPQIVADLHERFSSLQGFQIRSDFMPENGFIPAFPADKCETAFHSLKSLLQSDGWTLSEAIERLNLEELGAWYAGAILGFLLVVALATRNKTPANCKDEPLEVAAATAGLAVEAVPAVSEKDGLESIITELSSAVKSLTDEITEMKTAREKTQKDLVIVQNEFNTLKQKMEVSVKTERVLRKQILEGPQNQLKLKNRLEYSTERVGVLMEENKNLRDDIAYLKPRIAVNKLKTNLDYNEKRADILTEQNEKLKEDVQYLKPKISVYKNPLRNIPIIGAWFLKQFS